MSCENCKQSEYEDLCQIKDAEIDELKKKVARLEQNLRGRNRLAKDLTLAINTQSEIINTAVQTVTELELDI